MPGRFTLLRASLPFLMGTGLWACGAATESVQCLAAGAGYTSSALTASGSVALSRDDALLYATDSDNGILAVVSTATSQKIAEVPVGARPDRVLVGPDDVIYVSNRGERSVSVISRGTWTEADRLDVGIEPVGLGLSSDNGALYVVNSTSTTDPATGSLMAFDTCTHRLQWELSVGEEPRGIAMLAGNRALVTLYKQGDAVLVNLAQPALVQSGSSLYAALNARALAADVSQPLFETLHPRGLASAVASADGVRVFVPAMFSSEGLLPALSEGGSSTAPPPPSSGGAAYGGGTGCGGNTPPPLDGGGTDDGGASPDSGCFDENGCGTGGGGDGGQGDGGVIIEAALVPPSGPVVVAGTVTFAAEGEGLTPQVDDLLGRQDVPPGSDHPPTLFDPCASAQFQEPIAAAVQPGGRALWVVNRGTDNVAVVPMASTGSAAPFGFGGGQASAVAVGSGPTGIAFRRDGSLAYVHNAFDHSVVSIDPNALAPVGEPIAIAGEVLPADVAAGRKLFFSATDPAVTDPTNSISCASCHLEGREDGHVWHFTDGSRQTPQLVGRMVQSTAPYHWNGTLPTLHDFMNRTIQERMGGLGLTAQQESSIEAFLAAAPSPDNPFRGAELNPRQSRGQALFASARCGMCHEGAALTNNAFADVGTLVTGGLLPDDASTLPNGLNVPSLLGVGRSAPYLHDGSAATLEDRLRHNQAADQHGWTSTLSGEDIEDLVAFLKTL